MDRALDLQAGMVDSNQPGDWAEAKENVIAHQTILTGKDYPNCVRIPCQKGLLVRAQLGEVRKSP